MAEAVPILVAALSDVDPEGAAHYARNGEALAQTLGALDQELQETLEPARGAAFVPFHNAWPYFTRRYRLEQVVVIEPAPGREPSPAYIADALRLIQESGAEAVFSEVQLPQRPAEEAGCRSLCSIPKGAARATPRRTGCSCAKTPGPSPGRSGQTSRL